MSALDKALRQIDAQGHWQSARVGPDGARPDWDYPAAYVRPPKSLWMPLALVVLSLALLASCLVIVGWLPGPAALRLPSAQQASLPSAVSVPVPVPVPTAVQSAVQAAVPVGQAAAPAMPVLVQTPTPLNTAAPVTATEPAPALALPTAMVAVPEAVGQVSPSLAQKPTWHKAGSRPWGWGLWDEAARAWLKGLNSQDPGAPLLLIADQQTLLQATRVYARWATEMPVVVLPRPAATAKRWVVLAVPAPSMLEVAQQRLLAVQSAPVRVGSWAQWQMALGLADPAQAPTTASVSGLNTAAGHVPVPARLALAPAPSALPGAANAPAGSSVAAPEMAAQPLNKLLPENPQLSRTEAERLPASGPVSTAAKAIDVDFQAVEKNLARGEHQAALDAVTKLEKYIGENWRTQYLTGVALMGLARWELAAVALSKAQSLNPKHATTALYLSVTLQERGEHARAIQVLDMAQQLQPLSPELWLNQGHSHQALGHKAEARKSYNRFLELSVNRQDLAVQRVWVQNRLQKDNG